MRLKGNQRDTNEQNDDQCRSLPLATQPMSISSGGELATTLRCEQMFVQWLSVRLDRSPAALTPY